MRSYSGRLWDSKIDCANPSCRAATSAEVETYSAALKGCGEAAMSCVCP
jgi:hypothetical protein